MRRGPRLALWACIALIPGVVLGVAGLPIERGSVDDPQVRDPRPSQDDDEARELFAPTGSTARGAMEATPAASPPGVVAAASGGADDVGSSGPAADHALALANLALENEDLQQARAMARECLGLDPERVECHDALVFSFTRGGEYGAELRQAIDDCLGVAPRDPSCLETKVLSLVQQGEVEAARATLALRESLPDQPPDYIGEAEIGLALHQTDVACEAFRGACRVGQEFACNMLARMCATAAAPKPGAP